MNKKQGIFKEFKEGVQSNPKLALGLLWVSVMPAVGSLLLVPIALKNSLFFNDLNFDGVFVLAIILGLATLLMGLALLPTTILAGLSGFLFGWKAFPWLFLGYNLASILGYAWGKLLSEDSMGIILSKYPKAQRILEDKKERIGALIFFVRLSPVIPFALSNLLFAWLKTGYSKLVIFGSIGMLPRTTLVFLSGTLVSEIYEAIRGEGISGKGWIFGAFLLISLAGIWRFFKSERKK